MKAILIMGSDSDRGHAEKITSSLEELGVGFEVLVASAHKSPEKVLEIIRSYKKGDRVAFVTIAGRSNALSGFVAANTEKQPLPALLLKTRLI